MALSRARASGPLALLPWLSYSTHPTYRVRQIQQELTPDTAVCSGCTRTYLIHNRFHRECMHLAIEHHIVATHSSCITGHAQRRNLSLPEFVPTVTSNSNLQNVDSSLTCHCLHVFFTTLGVQGNPGIGVELVSTIQRQACSLSKVVRNGQQAAHQNKQACKSCSPMEPLSTPWAGKQANCGRFLLHPCVLLLGEERC